MNVIDLFSGAGGLSLGLCRAGAKLVACVEKNRDACDTHASHSPECEHYCKDIREIDFTRYRGRLDLVAGGPPCQPFSSGGLGRASQDRRDMIPEFIRCLSEARPPAFIMENVPGLVSRRHEHYFDSVLEELFALGYRLNWSIIYSPDYGVPQKRRRLFILGSAKEVLRFPKPTHGEGCAHPQPKSFDVVGITPLGEAPNSPVRFARNPDLRLSPYAGLLYNGGGRPIDPNGPCHTILASSGGYKTHWIDTEGVAPRYHRHLKEGGEPWEGEVPGARRLSVAECALIQTFPPEMSFCGTRSSQYTQVGDAVPVRLAHELASAVLAQLAGSHCVADLLDPAPNVRNHQPGLGI
jgi:DNA (cytosine-5)-methyltransferase 1